MRAWYWPLLSLAAILAVPAVTAAQAASAVTVESVIGMLQAGFNNTQILNLASQGCRAFRMTSATESRLKGAGANDALLEGLRGACERLPTREPQPAMGVLEIVGYLPPGWERSVNGSFVSTNRIVELTRTGEIVVRAPGYCPAQTTVTVPPGERQEWAPTMRARPWVGPCPVESDR
jgi:hypothetical protein